MVMPKPPKQFCIDSFEYKAYEGLHPLYHEPVFADAITIDHCRIDRGAEYSTVSNGKQLLYNAVIFCYQDITTPMPSFKTQSIIVFDDIEHRITKVIPIYEAYENKLYSVELEVV